MEELKELYARKGELVTAIELAQSELQQVNARIAELLNRQKQGAEKK